MRLSRSAQADARYETLANHRTDLLIFIRSPHLLVGGEPSFGQ
jgi:hypothetical protein